MVTPRQSPSGQLIDPVIADTYGFVDDFDVGPSVSGLISTSGSILQTGAGNWSIRSITNSGSFQGFSAEADHPGVLRFFTGNTANDAICCTKNQNNISSPGQIFSEKIDELEFIFLLQNTSLTTTQVKLFAGALDASFNPTSNLIQLSYDTSDAVSTSNWVARMSGATPIDTGVRVVPNTTAWWKYRMKRFDEHVELYINDVLEASFSNPPSGLVSTGFRVQTLAAGNRFITIDRIALQSKPLNR